MLITLRWHHYSLLFHSKISRLYRDSAMQFGTTNSYEPQMTVVCTVNFWKFFVKTFNFVNSVGFKNSVKHIPLSVARRLFYVRLRLGSQSLAQNSICCHSDWMWNAVECRDENAVRTFDVMANQKRHSFGIPFATSYINAIPIQLSNELWIMYYCNAIHVAYCTRANASCSV